MSIASGIFRLVKGRLLTARLQGLETCPKVKQSQAIVLSFLDTMRPSARDTGQITTLWMLSVGLTKSIVSNHATCSLHGDNVNDDYHSSEATNT